MKLEYDATAELCERFNHVHTGQHRVARKVSGEHRFVISDVFETDGAHPGLEFQNTIYEQNRIPVRQDLHDLPDIEFGHRLLYFRGRKLRVEPLTQFVRGDAMQFMTALDSDDFKLRPCAEQREIAE